MIDLKTIKVYKYIDLGLFRQEYTQQKGFRE